MPSVSTWYPESKVCKSCTVSLRQQCSRGETLCGWQCAQTRETCSSTRISEWLRENTGEPFSRLTGTSSRTHRTPERSSRRAPATVCPIQTSTRRVSLPNMAGGGRRDLIPTVRSSQGAGKGVQRGGERAEGAEGAPDGTTLHVGACSVRQWPGDGESWGDRAGRDRGGVVEPRSQAAHLGIGCGQVSRDVEHSRDPPERLTSANSGETPNANAQTLLFRRMRRISTSWHAFSAKEGPAPPTNNERKIQSQLEHRRMRAEGKYN